MNIEDTVINVVDSCAAVEEFNRWLSERMETEKQIVNDYKMGHGFDYLRSRYKISVKTVRSILMEAGIEVRPTGHTRGVPSWNKGFRLSVESCPKGHLYDKENTAFTPDGFHYCRTCKRNKTREWKDNLDEESDDSRKARMRESAKERNRRYRREAIEAYGGKCVCCGESIPEFLHLDHVNNDGAEHRRELGKNNSSRESGSMKILTWARNNNWPDVLQLKCHNCGMAEGFYGRCPHEDGRDRKQRHPFSDDFGGS